MAYSRTRLASLWQQAGGAPGLAPTMAAIALAESGGDPRATHRDSDGTIDRGLWQINSIHGYGTRSFDPLANAREAVAIERGSGLDAWSTYQSGAYERYMTVSSGRGAAAPSVPRSGDAFVENASRYVGTPYVWGGNSPKGFDCSGLVEYVLSNMGIRNVPRTSEAQYAWTQRVGPASLQAGDLVFLNFPGETSPGHVMIYAGGNEVIQAPSTGQLVQEDSFDPRKPGKNEWGATVVGYGRVPGLSYAGEPSGPLSGPVVLPGQGNVPGQGNARSRPGTGSGGGWAGDAWGDFETAVGDAGGDVGSLFSGLVDTIEAPLDFLKAALWLVNPLNWLRAAEIVFGFVLILLGVLIAVGADKVVRDVAGSAAASKIPVE
jgi:cell wall-associated NlpC family hydrolase